ncbi:hypothetical protein [Leptospira santarosai]|uniref:hypothetical protein n=1 Tax=Leptospira santarosai TaxID=28183 RepID=UPI00036787E8|nr:hypothetical protein [Leptospira santarosai]
MTPDTHTPDRVRIAFQAFELAHGYRPNREEQIAILRAEGFDPETIAFFREAASAAPRHTQEVA